MMKPWIKIRLPMICTALHNQSRFSEKHNLRQASVEMQAIWMQAHKECCQDMLILVLNLYLNSALHGYKRWMPKAQRATTDCHVQ